MEEMLKQILDGQNSIIKRIDSFEKSTNERFEKIGERFEKIETRLDGIDSRLDEMDDRFTEVNDHFAKIDKRLDKIEDDIEEIREESHITRVAVNRMGDRLESLLTELNESGIAATKY